LTIFVDEQGAEIAVMYRHSDGFPTGHGADLVEWGGQPDRWLVNGFQDEDMRAMAWNRMDQLAADCVRHFSEQGGPPPLGVCICPPGTRDRWEEFRYILTAKPIAPREKDFGTWTDKKERWGVWLKVEDTYGDGHVLYDGWLSEYTPRDNSEDA
jgi:hypothetical protein